MTDQEKVEAAMRKAQAAGDNEALTRLVDIHRKLTGSPRQAETSSGPSEQNQDPSLWDRFQYGVDQPLEMMGETADAVGWEGAGQWLKDATEAPYEAQESASAQFMDGDGWLGYDWSQLPSAAVEQSGQFAGSMASRGAGAAGGAAVAGPVGGVIGGLAGPAAFEAVQVLGPVANERARNNGREEPNAEDWKGAVATAAASGALNSLGPKVAGPLRRIVTEGATEGVQSGIQQAGETAGTNAGLQVDPKQAVGEGILGGSSAGVVDTGVAATREGTRIAREGAAETSARIRYDQGPYDEDHVRAAQRLKDAADGDMKKLSNTDSTQSGEGSRSYANTAIGGGRKELSRLSRDLKKLAKKRGNDREADIALERVKSSVGSLKSSLSQNDIEEVRRQFPDEPDAERFISTARQVSFIQPMSQGTGDVGGFSKYTRIADPTDGRNEGIARGIAYAGGWGTIGGGIALNRGLRGVDRLTNRRSTIKRFIESVDREVGPAPEIQGETAAQKLDAIDRTKRERKNLDKLTKRFDKVGKQIEKEQERATKETAEKRRAEELAEQLTAQQASTQKYFDGEAIPDPADDPKVTGLSIWEEATGTDPETTLNVLEQLEREGIANRGTAEKYRNGANFSKQERSREVPHLQELVRERANPQHKVDYNEIKRRQQAGKLKGGDPESLAKELSVDTLRPTGSRRKDKAKRGSLASQNLSARITNAERELSPAQYRGLSELRSVIDSPNMTRQDRYAAIDEAIPRLFPRQKNDKAARDYWAKSFTPLAAEGNDYRIEREQEADQALEEKTEQAKKKSKKKAKGTPKKEEREGKTPPKTKADKALVKLQEPSKSEPLDQSKSEPEDPIKDEEPKLPKVEKPKKKAEGRKSVSDMVSDRIEQINYELQLAENEAPTLQGYMESLGKGIEDRIRGLLLEAGSDQVTVNMLGEMYAKKFSDPDNPIKPEAAIQVVNNALDSMEKNSGDVKRVSRFKANNLIDGGKPVKDADGNALKVLHIEYPESGTLYPMMEIAKAVQRVNKMVNQDQPDVMYDPDNLSEGPHKMFPKIPNDRITGEHKPMFDFGNTMRSVRFGASNQMLTQIEDALEARKKNPKRANGIGGALLPDGKSDLTNVRTVAQMLWQMGDNPNFRQEWSFDTRGRIYSKNGLAHSQAGDMMKGAIRASEPSPVGGQSSLDFMFHSFGNLLGVDKESPRDRRNFVFEDDNLKNLIEWSKDPFGRTAMVTSKGKAKPIQKLVDDGEGVFQVLNAANELRSMYEWASERHGDRDPKELLADPAVREDLAMNYSTDFIVQLDASNNAYQIASLAMGYQDGMAATGLIPQGGDPDSTKGADIYVAPAQAVAERIQPLKELRDSGIMSDGKLRKLFKTAVGNYLYDASHDSRKASFRDRLTDMANGAKVVGIDGTGLLEVPSGVVNSMQSDEGFTTERIKYSKGEAKTERVNRKVIKDGDRFRIQNQTGNAKPTQGRPYDTAEEAIEASYENDLYTQMGREIVQEIESRYPRVREYMNFASKVTSMLKEDGQTVLNLRAPDGVPLEYHLKEDAEFDAVPVEMGGNVFQLGVRSDRVKNSGRGLAASMTHMLDAYVLRETHRRLQEEGPLKTFNPIHDSFGFHPSDTERGQAKALEVMQEIGSGEYDLFMTILQENGINPRDFIKAGGIFPQRDRIQPQKASDIPTAIS